MATVSLHEFIRDQCGIAINTAELDNADDTLELLANLYLSPTHEPVIQLNVGQQEQRQWTIHELLNRCKLALVNNRRVDNVLVQGYKMAGDGTIDSNLCRRSTDVNVPFLKTPPWRRIHALVGDYNLSNILLNYSGFLKTGRAFVHLFGPSIQKKFCYKRDKDEAFSLDRVLYKSKYHAERLNPIPLKERDFVKEVFRQEYPLQEKTLLNLRKRHKPFMKLCSKVIENHRRVKYFQILFNICKQKENVNDNLQLAIDKKDIMKFCTVVFDSVFRKELYGSSRNKSHIFKCLSLLVLGQKGTQIALTDCAKGICLKEIPWLGKMYDGNLNKQDFIKREKLMKTFISWLFQTFFPKLLASFFHITHISSSNELFFFHHKTWDRISEPFIQKYLETYLVERDILSDIALNADFTDSIKSRFKVMPKKANDFRVINTPLRGLTPSKDFEYMNKVNNEIRPAKRILNQLRLSQTSKFRKITSMSQISRFIGQFKEVLNENYSQIPELYFVKFDVKACYDSIPADKVSKILHELVEKEEVYYSGTRSDVDLVSATSKTCRTLSKSDNVDGLFQNFQPHTRPLIVGKTHVHSMLGDEILNIAKSQLEHTLTKIRGRYYSRKIGVFQGLHHSSLFCDILYDRLIDDKFHFLAETESIILRVADDFLVVSTDASLTSRSKKLLENGMIADYGITINELKTVVNFSSLGDYEDSVGSIKFCGFKIDTCNLDLIKEFDNNNNNNSMISAVACRSHKKLVDRLLRMYKIRISYNTLSMRVNSFDSILKQLSIIVETVAISYCVCSKRVILTLKGLESFIRSLIKESAKVMKFDYVEKSQQLQAEIRIIETFLKVLKTKNTRFAAFISYLQQQIYIRQDH